MKRIHITDCLSTGLSPHLASARTLDLAHTPMGEGGFGVVHRGTALNDTPLHGQIVKLLTNKVNGVDQRGFKTIRELQQLLKTKNETLHKSGTTLFATYPALLGVPQMSFQGTLDGEIVLGYTANDLGTLGMEDFGPMLEDEGKVLALQALPLSARLELASQLVAAFELLGSLNYIHADFKPEALFVDLNQQHPKCAVIDFDSGAIISNPLDKPTTVGTKQAWLAPEVLKQLGPSGKPGRVQVSVTSDFWAVAMAVHHLLFACHPMFFLNEVSDRSMKDYRQHFQWPDAERHCIYFNRTFEAAHSRYASYLRSNLPDLVKPFASTLCEGYSNPSRRTSYSGWKMALAAQNRPEIISFTADRILVDDAVPVRLHWEVRGSGQLELSGIGDVTGRRWCDVIVRRDTLFLLVLTPPAGSSLSSALQVEVSKQAPIVHSFVSDRTQLRDAAPAVLTWKVTGAERIEIDPGIGSIAHRSSCEIAVKNDTTVTLTATSRFGVVTKAMLQLTVSKQKPTIAFFRASRTLLQDRTPVKLCWWVSSDAARVTIEGIGIVANGGSVLVSPKRNITYKLIATSAFDYSSVARVDIAVSSDAPVIEIFHASPSLTTQQSPVTLTWKVNGAETVTVEPGVGELPASGSCSVQPLMDTVYLLRAKGYFGAESARALRVRVLTTTILPASATIVPPITDLSTCRLTAHQRPGMTRTLSPPTAITCTPKPPLTVITTPQRKTK